MVSNAALVVFGSLPEKPVGWNNVDEKLRYFKWLRYLPRAV
jgi:hypothetical protein